MATKDERTSQMIKEYFELYQQGYTPKEVAKKFGLSDFTVYRYLGEIAEENGVTRASLLQIPHSTHAEYERQFAPIKPVDLTDFQQGLKATIENFGKLRTAITQGIHEEEENIKKVEEEERIWQQSR